MGCEQAELVVLFETIEEKIEYMCGEKIKPECYNVIRRILNDLREYGKDYVRSKYGI
ncbi:MAG: hypothetical protein F7C37_06475 [Desulfurococcales archaeon]|nr:hypothetical protein [Desulfurococcales archaeon]